MSVWLLGGLILGTVTARAQTSLKAPIEPRKVAVTHGHKGDIGYRTSRIRYPVVRGLPETIRRRVQNALSLKTVTGESLETWREDSSLDEINYKVNYNANALLDVTFTISTIAAYPDEHKVHIALNLKTGEPLRALQVFRQKSLPTLVAMGNRAMQAEIARAIREAHAVGEADKDVREDLRQHLDGVKFELNDLDNFEISSRGITFLCDFQFQHYIKALQPPGRYFFPFTALRPHITPDGPLGVFLRPRS